MNENEDTPKNGAAIVAIVLIAPSEQSEPSDGIQDVCRRFGKEFQEGREQSGRTRAQLAEECEVELSVIEKIESGDVRAVKELAYGFGVEAICRSLGYEHLFDEDTGEA